MCAAWSGGWQVGGGGNPQPGLTKVPQAGPAFLLSTPQLLQRRRRPPAPGRAPGRRGLISSYQVRPVTCDSGWGRADCSGTQEQASKSRERLYPCGRGSWARGLAGLRSPPPTSCFPRPRSSERWPWTWGQEAVSRGVSHQPRLQEVPPRPPSLLCPGSSMDPAHPSTPHSIIPSSLPVRSRQVV